MLGKRFFILAVLSAGALALGPAAVILPGAPQVAHAQAESPKAGAGSAQPEKAEKKKRSRRRTLVEADKVRIEPLIQTMPVIGRLVAVRSGVVAARIDAPVAEMKVDIGDKVKKGDVLAVLVNEKFKWDRAQRAAEVAEARAQIDTVKARLELARQELNRIEELKTSAAFSKARYEDKRVEVTRHLAELAEARAKLKRTQATLELAETQFRYTFIRAPYDGTITKRHTEAGAFVKEGEAIFSMVSDRDLEIEADVPARRIGGTRPGDKVSFELEGNTTFEATVRAVVPEEDPRTRTRTVRFTPNFSKRPATLAANQSATVHLPIGQRRMVLSVHKDAIVNVRGMPTVFVVEDGRAHARPIEIGEGVGGRFEVKNGLKEGDIVVTRGNERLKDGRRVRVDGITN